MIKTYLVDMLVRKIVNKEINPKTNEAYKVEDIKIEEYKVAVQTKLDKLKAAEPEEIVTE